MSFTPKPNRGYLWTNDRKTEDTHPDFRGDSAIDKALLMKLIEKGDDPVKIADPKGEMAQAARLGPGGALGR